MAAKVAVLWFMISSLFLSLLLAPISADGAVDVDVDAAESGLRIEVDTLKSKIRALESSVEEKSTELKSKEEALALKDRAIKEKTDRVESLQGELSSLQKKGKIDAAVEIGKAYALTEELEKQVEKLNQEVEAKIKQKEDMEDRLSKSETKISVLVMKHDKLEKTIEEQKSKLRKTERALKVAEEELVKAKQEATAKITELTEVHAAWLPPWLSSHWSQCQSFIEMHWNVHGKPATDIIIQKALEKKAQAEEWAAPHVAKMKKEYLPAVRQQSLAIKASLVHHIQTLATKAVEIYDTSREAVTPHVTKLQEVVDPYYQEARKLSKPYIEQVATLSKPHIDNLRLTMKPYTKKAVHTYGKFLKSATSYHNQIQGSVEDTMKRHELTKSFATKEFVWFVASALLALPIIILFKFLSALFGTKSKRHARGSHKTHARRKAKTRAS
ncbi:hypothetical protein MLD38_014135 [Melastoma candidum]|uniref:Uncharacterized protein n=1 Tax=Melastoma candidum TaxID=119954 RepID=A0ACB9RB72_9MYRT|nr:hypothetical protein MLD38_014135 [Melastoma candidum]